MPLRDGPRTIYRANNDARDMSDYLLDRGRERHQSPEERAKARVPGPEPGLNGWLSAAGPVIPETPRRPPVKLPWPDRSAERGWAAGPER